jgi:hypothetical protein
MYVIFFIHFVLREKWIDETVAISFLGTFLGLYLCVHYYILQYMTLHAMMASNGPEIYDYMTKIAEIGFLLVLVLSCCYTRN